MQDPTKGLVFEVFGLVVEGISVSGCNVYQMQLGRAHLI